MSITGNLTVSGTQTFVNTSTVTTNDSLIKLAANNTVGDVLDIGFYGQSNTGTSVAYHGLVRQAAGNFVLFKNIGVDPSVNVVNTALITTANTATLRANITGGTVSSLASAIGIADGGTNQTSFTNGIVAYNGTALATLANTGTAGTYANAAYVPVITTDAYGRVSSITNTAISISATAVTGIHTFAQGGTNAASYTTGSLLTSNGTAFVSVSNTGTAGTYANAAYVPVITTDAYGRVSAVTNTAIAIDTSQLASGTIADARLAGVGTAGTYANAAYVPVITTDSKGRVTAITNTAIAISATAVSGIHTFAQGGTNAASYTTGSLLTSNGTALVSVSNTGTAGTYANASYVPVITTDAYGRVSSVTNTLIQISTTQVTSGVLPFAQGGSNNTTYTTGAILTSNGTAFVALSNTGTAGTYANAAYVPVITTDAYGRVSSITNTAIGIDTSQLVSGTIADARLPTKGSAGTYASATYVPVITLDAYGRVTAVTNTAISFPAEADTLQTVTTRGSTTANAISITNTTISTSNTTGALTVSGGLGVNGNVYSANIFATGDVVAGIFDGPTLAGATNPIIAAIGNVNSYVQNYVVNYSNTVNASADWAAYPNNGNDTSGWIDMGITSNTYAQSGYNTTGRNEGYLLMSAPIGSGTSGNLVIATDSTGTYNSIEHYPGGFNSNKGNSVLTITTQTSSTSNTTGGVVVRNGLGVRGNVATDGIVFADGTRQTTAASGGVAIGDVLALAIALG